MKSVKTFILLTFLGFCLSLPLTSNAQCPMCRASAETSLKEGNTSARGLNKGILYLFVTPYLIAGTIGFLFWWNNRNRKDEHEELDVA